MQFPIQKFGLGALFTAISALPFVAAQGTSSGGEAAAAGVAFFGIIGFFIIVFLLGIASFIFWIFMIIDCAKRDFENDNEKLLWILVMLFAGVVGALIYLFVVKSKK